MSKRCAKGRRDSDRCHIVGRTVNFNLEDPLQKQMYEETLRWTNFSGHIKRLLETHGTGRLAPIDNSSDVPEPAMVVSKPIEDTDDDFDPVASLFGRAI